MEATAEIEVEVMAEIEMEVMANKHHRTWLATLPMYRPWIVIERDHEFSDFKPRCSYHWGEPF